jgi:hypothetical protein
MPLIITCKLNLDILDVTDFPVIQYVWKNGILWLRESISNVRKNKNPISCFEVTWQYSEPPLAALYFILPHVSAITVVDYGVSRIFRTFLGGTVDS